MWQHEYTNLSSLLLLFALLGLCGLALLLPFRLSDDTLGVMCELIFVELFLLIEDYGSGGGGQ